MRLEHIRRLDDVIIHRNQNHVVFVHGSILSLLRRILGPWPALAPRPGSRSVTHRDRRPCSRY
jgi:hypothetical protein